MGVENFWQSEISEQSEQQKQILNTMQWLKNEATESLTDSNLMKLCNDALIVVEVDLNHNEKPTQTILENYRQYFTSLQNLQSFESLNRWFNDFTNILILLQPKTKQIILDAIAINDSLSLSKYFTENWFPTNKLEFELLGRKLGITIDNYPVNEKKERELYNVDDANIEKLLNIYDVIQPNIDQSEVFILLKSLSEGNKEVYPKLKTLLLSQPEELAKLLNAVIDADKANNTTHYESLKYTLLTIDPAFEAVISNYENKNQEKIDSLYKAHVYSLSWAKPKMNGNLFESTNDHGDTISIDLSKKPPYRTLSLAGSEYTLEANRDLGELHQPNLEYQKQKATISAQLKTVNILQTANIQEHIADLVNHEYQLSEIKRLLKLAYGINADFINTLDDLASPYNIEAKQTKLEKQLKKVENDYNQELSAAIASHREKIFEQDEKTREVLKFISDIGLDLLPKKYTDQIINEVKSWMIIVDGMNLNPSKLDLKSWLFGESPIEAWTNQWKENLIMFYNKMISGSVDKPLNIAAHLGLSGKTEDKTKVLYYLKSNNIISSWWSFNITLVRENLNASL